MTVPSAGGRTFLDEGHFSNDVTLVSMATIWPILKDRAITSTFIPS
jgi:hypothetical protein